MLKFYISWNELLHTGQEHVLSWDMQLLRSDAIDSADARIAAL